MMFDCYSCKDPLPEGLDAHIKFVISLKCNLNKLHSPSRSCLPFSSFLAGAMAARRLLKVFRKVSARTKVLMTFCSTDTPAAAVVFMLLKGNKKLLILRTKSWLSLASLFECNKLQFMVFFKE